MCVDIGSEYAVIRPVGLRRSDDPSGGRVDHLVPLRLDNQTVHSRMVGTRLLMTIGIRRSLSASLIVFLRFALDDSFHAVVRNTPMDTIRLREVPDVEDAEKIRRIVDVAESFVRKVSRSGEVVIDEGDVCILIGGNTMPESELVLQGDGQCF